LTIAKRGIIPYRRAAWTRLIRPCRDQLSTDNSFDDGIADYVGLLCIQPAKSGGLSQVVSGYSVHNELLAKHRDLLEILYQPWHI
jgi:hypothetical protein